MNIVYTQQQVEEKYPLKEKKTLCNFQITISQPVRLTHRLVLMKVTTPAISPRP